MTHNFREVTEARQARELSPHACLPQESRGRLRPEADDQVRTCFQRDRDRILHAKSFRRLAHKTQVFLSPEGDHYRTRITHTLEVTQIARTITRALGLNEDLTEAVGLGHDLGHTPFGHAGEATLRKLLAEGFHHARQSVRVVDLLERDGKGLNLTQEVREGILKHSKGKGTILVKDPRIIASTLEAQVVRVADIIAYVNHDLDDSLRAKVLKETDVPWQLQERIGSTHSERITRLVCDVIDQSDLEAEPRIRMSEAMNASLLELRAFLYERVYDNRLVHEEFVKTERLMTALWEHFTEHDPDTFRKRYWPAGLAPEHTDLRRAVADFIAGMTDRYALRVFEELYLPKRWPVL